MKAKDSFEFLNSPVWIKYTHQKYRTLEEIQHRVVKSGEPQKKWLEEKHRILVQRKTNAIPLFLKSLDKNFWFYPADCIIQKAEDLEKRGVQLYQKIATHVSFKNEFFVDSMIEEAVTSAIYEGANSTRAQAQELLVSARPPKNKDEWMLVNNYRALALIRENQTSDVSLSLIRAIHQTVTRSTLEGDDANYSGRFRDDIVRVISRSNQVVHEGIKFDLIELALTEALMVATKNQRHFPKIIKGILLHYFVAYIHPFFDGNGRTARTLFYLKAIKNDLGFVELLSLSAYLKNHGTQYEKAFEKVIGNDLDVTYFIDFNLDALLQAITEIEKKVDYLLSIGQLKQKYELTDNQVGLLQRLALNRFRKVSIEDYAQQIDKSREVSRQELQDLCKQGFLTEEKDSKKFVYKIDKQNLNKYLGKKS
jgi:Fic family protein